MEPLASTKSGANALARVRYTHDGMIDYIIQNPGISGRELSLLSGYTQAWVSRVICSDAFQARLAARKDEMVTPGIAATIEERLKGMAMQSMDLLVEKLGAVDDDGESTADTATVIKAIELSTKSLGYGARQTNVAIQNNLTVNTATDEQLMEIAQGG